MRPEELLDPELIEHLTGEAEELKQNLPEDIQEALNSPLKLEAAKKLAQNPAITGIVENIANQMDAEAALAGIDTEGEEEKRRLREAAEASGDSADLDGQNEEKKKEGEKKSEEEEESFVKRDTAATAAAIGACFIPAVGPLIGLAIAIAYLSYRSKGKDGEKVDPEEQEIQDLMTKFSEMLMSGQSINQPSGPSAVSEVGDEGYDEPGIDPVDAFTSMTGDAIYENVQVVAGELVKRAEDTLDAATNHVEEAERRLSGEVPAAEVAAEAEQPEAAAEAEQPQPPAPVAAEQPSEPQPYNRTWAEKVAPQAAETGARVDQGGQRQ